MDGWNTTLLLGSPIFRGYVSFREGKSVIVPLNNDFLGMIDLDHVFYFFTTTHSCHSHITDRILGCPASPASITRKKGISHENSNENDHSDEIQVLNEIFARNGSKDSDDIPIPGGRQCKQRAAVHRCK